MLRRQIKSHGIRFKYKAPKQEAENPEYVELTNEGTQNSQSIMEDSAINGLLEIKQEFSEEWKIRDREMGLKSFKNREYRPHNEVKQQFHIGSDKKNVLPSFNNRLCNNRSKIFSKVTASGSENQIPTNEYLKDLKRYIEDEMHITKGEQRQGQNNKKLKQSSAAENNLFINDRKINSQSNKLLRRSTDKQFFMSRTNYWTNSSSSMTDRKHHSNKSLTRLGANTKKPQNKGNQMQESYRYFENMEPEGNEFQGMSKSLNKSFVVREMLHQIKRCGDQPVAATESKSMNLLTGISKIKRDRPQQIKNRHSSMVSHKRTPFDPYLKNAKKKHMLKFTPIKLEEEVKRAEIEAMEQDPFSLEDFNIKLTFQRPTYCKWIEKNRSFIEKRKEKNSKSKSSKLVSNPLKVVE